MAIFNRDKKASKEPQDALAPQGARELARTERSLTVGKLEEALLKDFPAQDAEEWDRTGLLVGERDLPLAGVAIALDATVPAIAEAWRSRPGRGCGQPSGTRWRSWTSILRWT